MKNIHHKNMVLIKRYIVLNVLIFLMIASFSATAQNWAPIGAKWHFTKHHNMSSEVSYTSIEVEKDTLVLGKKCSKLIGVFDECIWQSSIMYESNDSVYFYHSQNNDFSFLYDFGASPGDLWEINNITSFFGAGLPDTTKVLVDSVGQMLINGEMLRVIYTSQINFFESDYEFGGMIIEKVGAHSFYPWLFSCDPPAGNVRCYEDDDIFYQRDSSIACDYVTLSVSKSDIEILEVSPNPVTDELRVNNFDFLNYSSNFQLLDMSGKIALEGKMKSNTIDVSGLIGGMYTFNLRDMNNELLLTTKILKL